MSTSDSDQFDRDVDGQFDRDDDLRALLRGGDPASSLPSADRAALSSLLEDIMSADLDIRPETDSPETAAGGRRTKYTWLVAAAAAAVIAGIGGYALSGIDSDSGTIPQAGESRTTTTTGGTSSDAPVAGQTTDLTATVPQGRCAVPDASFIAGSEQAFQGTVTSIDGDQVTLEATDVYAGQVGETVHVTALQTSFASLISTVDFQVGGTYLISATDGMVSLCGLSGQATNQLRSLYETAFVR